MSRAELVPVVDGDATLRMLTRSDLALTLAWRNHPSSRIWFHSTDEISFAGHRSWFERYLDRDDDHVFILERAQQAVAQVALYDIRDDSAEFGRLLVDPGARGRGHALRATLLCLRAADALRIRRLHLEVKADNAAAIRVYEHAGFRRTATLATAGSIVMARESE
jgi:RimJ/RimL family protein N-acetyltransferase